MPLTDRDRAILEFEAEWRRHVGAKEEAIRADLALSPARYYQLLGRLIDTTDAQEHDPMLVKRLRRQRDAVRAASGIEQPVHGAGTGSPSAAG